MKQPNEPNTNGGKGSSPPKINDPALNDSLNKCGDKAYYAGFTDNDVENTIRDFESSCEESKEAARQVNLADLEADESVLDQKEKALEAANLDDLEDIARVDLRPEFEADIGNYNAIEVAIKINGRQSLAKIAPAKNELNKIPPFVQKHSREISLMIGALAGVAIPYDGLNISELVNTSYEVLKIEAYIIGFFLSGLIFACAHQCALYYEKGQKAFSKIAFYFGLLIIASVLFFRIRHGDLLGIITSIGMLVSFVVVILGLIHIFEGLKFKNVNRYISDSVKQLTKFAQQVKINEAQKIARISQYDSDVRKMASKILGDLKAEIQALRNKIDKAKTKDQQTISNYSQFKASGVDFIQSRFEQGVHDRKNLHLDDLFS